MQAYNIDLIEEQGKLHWKKFNALLSGLPDGTKFVEVMKIRAWKPSKGIALRKYKGCVNCKKNTHYPIFNRERR